MGKPFNVLIATTCADDAATIAQVLQFGCPLYFERVERMDAFERALSGSCWNLVVCDAAGFDIEKALALSPSPIVFIAGDDDADSILSALKAGARHVVLRSRITDLADIARNPYSNESAFFEKFHQAVEQSAVCDGNAEIAFATPAWTESVRQSVDEQFHVSFDFVPVGMAHISLDGTWLRSNPKLCEIMGYGESELHGIAFHVCTHPDDLPRMLELQTSLLVGKIPSFSMEQRLKRSDNQTIWARLTVSIMRDDRNCPCHLIAAVEDITHLKKIEEQFHFLVNHDTLTKLPNRKSLLDQLGHQLTHAESAGRKLAILFLDLDRFKLINDSLGHASGDRLMGLCGQHIAACLDAGDFAARLGSDEFAIVCSDAESMEAISAYSERVLRAISTPVQIEEMGISITGCIGISVYPDDGDDISTLLRKADSAMYRAKDAGGNHFRFYTSDMDVSAIDHLLLENDLRRAILCDEFVLHYQPQVDLDTGKMIAMEALLRWNHPIRGIVAPSEFIMLAEETGLIVQIGEWVLRTACMQAKSWQNMGMEQLRIAVNLSPRQFHKQDLARVVMEALESSALAPEFLELEITESAIMHKVEESILTLQHLKKMGVKISIDDFGTGYSSLSYLKEFPIDKIKIDQSFVENITSSPDNAALANGIIALAHSIKLSVTAEGVENRGQLNFLSLSQCDSIQGFYFCTPLPAESLQKFIEQGKSLDTGRKRIEQEKPLDMGRRQPETSKLH